MNLLEKADKLDDEARELCREALMNRHKYLKSKGWDIRGDMIGPTITYFYSKCDAIYICEYDALDHEEFGCSEPS